MTTFSCPTSSLPEHPPIVPGVSAEKVKQLIDAFLKGVKQTLMRVWVTTVIG